MKINNCVCCDSTELELILDLGNHPWCNNFLTKEEIGTEEYYPLQLMCCIKCNFLQLSYFVPKEKMFSKHDYVSGTTKTLAKHFKEVAEDVTKQYNIPKDGLIVDIGGNDGTNLLQYRNLGYSNLLNIEAAGNIARLSEKNKIETYNEFFNENTVILGRAKIINASGVFFHLEEIHSVLRGINKVLDDDGVLVVQFMYVMDMLKNKTFDMIYHEHLFYYTLKSLSELILKYGLYIQDCYHSDIHSGSMIAYIKKMPENIYANLGLTDRFRECYKQELEYFEYNKYLEKYRNFGKEIKNKAIDNKLLKTLYSLQERGENIYGLGAAAKSNTLLNYFGVDKNFLTKTHEINPLKIGKYTPHTHIPIEQEDPNDLPDYYLVLAHNFFDEIIEKNKHLQEKGVKFILLFPEIKIV